MTTHHWRDTHHRLVREWRCCGKRVWQRILTR